MPYQKAAAASADYSLAELSAWIWQNETGYGPIAALGNNGANTAAVFRYSDTEPTTQATVQPKGSPAPPGLTLVCKGIGFISGALTHLEVWR
jgi:hypothetical protein